MLFASVTQSPSFFLEAVGIRLGLDGMFVFAAVFIFTCCAYYACYSISFLSVPWL